jgi:heterotetrameric sarcosine oxidase gamma subunit
MDEPAPVARSPITVRADASTARAERGRLWLRDETLLVKVLVRATPNQVVAETLGVRMGGVARGRDGSLIVGSGPGEWLVIAPPGGAAAVADRLAAAATDALVTIVDVTSGRILLRLTGGSSSAVLAKLCAVDLDTLPSGSVLRTSVADVVTEVVRDDVTDHPPTPTEPVRSYLLSCDASYGQYLFDVLLDAGREHGIQVDGLSDAGR